MKSSPAETLKVLVVDDDAQMLRSISDILRLGGYSAVIAGSGSEAIDITRKMKFGPAVALVDLQLPDMDGIELVGRLREIAGLTEVVILTGNASVDSAVRALRENSNDYLVKPVQPEHLIGTIERAAERWQRKRAEEAMRQSQDRLRLIFDHVSDALYIADDAGRIIDANPAACTLSGESLEQIQTRNMTDVLPQNGTHSLDVRSTAFAPGVLVYTVRDLTRQRKLEDQLMQAQKMEAVGQLAGGVAHDFNNLLTVIMSYSSLLLAGAPPPATHREGIPAISDAPPTAARATPQLPAFPPQPGRQPQA